MKIFDWLPHFLYLSLLSGCGLFYWRALQHESQLLAFLHRPTDEAYTVVQQNNLKIKESIIRNISAYRNANNALVEQRLNQADSLLKKTLSGEINMNELRAGLDTSVWGDKVIVEGMANLLPSRRAFNLSSPTLLTMAQNDSVRQQIALMGIFSYWGSKMSGIDIVFDSFEPVFSPTTLCTTAGQHFQMDVFLSPYANKSPIEQVSINGEALVIENHLAHYHHTFDAPGDYPLKIEARTEVYNSSDDSVIATQKTFFIHINR